jgi:hypothetical protein
MWPDKLSLFQLRDSSIGRAIVSTAWSTARTADKSACRVTHMATGGAIKAV